MAGNLNSSQCRHFASGISIEGQSETFGQPLDDAHLFLGEGCAQGSHYVAEAVLVGDNDIHVAFYHYCQVLLPYGWFGPVNAVEGVTLIKGERLRRVEVFGQGIIERACSKAQDSSGCIPNREHQSVAEAVICARLSLLFYQQAGSFQVILSVATLYHFLT